MKYLLDTNIFLEILLNQVKKKACINFIQQNAADCALPDFSLHSIGIITFKQGKSNLFEQICNDVLRHLTLVSLPVNSYASLAATFQRYNLDFDDSYQFILSQLHSLTIVTMDADFRKVQHVVPVEFL